MNSGPFLTDGQFQMNRLPAPGPVATCGPRRRTPEETPARCRHLLNEPLRPPERPQRGKTVRTGRRIAKPLASPGCPGAMPPTFGIVLPAARRRCRADSDGPPICCFALRCPGRARRPSPVQRCFCCSAPAWSARPRRPGSATADPERPAAGARDLRKPAGRRATLVMKTLTNPFFVDMERAHDGPRPRPERGCWWRRRRRPRSTSRSRSSRPRSATTDAIVIAPAIQRR